MGADRPTGYDALRATIRARHVAMPAVLRRIAEFALQHPNEMALDTVAVARRLGLPDRRRLSLPVLPSTGGQFGKLSWHGGFLK